MDTTNPPLNPSMSSPPSPPLVASSAGLATTITSEPSHSNPTLPSHIHPPPLDLHDTATKAPDVGTNPVTGLSSADPPFDQAVAGTIPVTNPVVQNSVPGVTGANMALSVSTSSPNETHEAPHVQPHAPFVPSLGAWAKRINIIPELKDPIPQTPPPSDTPRSKGKIHLANDILPPEVKENGQLRFPWASKMDPKHRNLYRTTSPTYMEDGTPIVVIPNHVLMQGLANQKEYVIGQFYRCITPSGGLVHAVTNRIWGKKCKIFTRKLGESSFLFHIPDESTRDWVLERKLWHIDGCIMFVGPWTPAASLALPEITSVPVWVTLKNIPHCLYSDWGISWIASGLGEPMLTNKPRLDPTQIGEAKLMVEVELDKSFPQRIAAEDKQGNVSMVSVEYSWIPTKCERCGQLGHKVSRCLQPDVGFTLASAPITVTNSVVIADAPCTDVETASTFSTISTPARDTTLTVVDIPLATITTSVSPRDKAKPATPTVPSHDLATTTALVYANTTPSFGLPMTPVTVSTPTHKTSFDEDDENDFGGNQFAALQSGVYSGFEIGDFSLKSRVGRSIKPTQKVQEMQWSLVGGRGKKGRGGRGGHGPPV